MKLRNKKTGEIGYTAVLRSKAIVVMDENAIQLGSYTSLAELNDEWEDYEEPKEYWFINNYDRIEKEKGPDDAWFVIKLKEIGNYFETKEEAEKAVEKLKAWKRLKDKNFHFLKYSALGCGEIKFSLDFEDMYDEGEIGELQHDLELLFGGEE